MPFPNYDEGDVAAMATEDELYSYAALRFGSDLHTSANLTPLADQVGEIEKVVSEYKALCAEIVTTLTLEGNGQWFADLPPDWHDRVSEWKKRLDSLGE